MTSKIEAANRDRRAILEELRALHWQPADLRERVLVALAREDWKAIASEGPAAAPLLVGLAIRYNAEDGSSDYNRSYYSIYTQLGEALAASGPEAAGEPLVAAAEQQGGWLPLVVKCMLARAGGAWPTELLVRSLAVGVIDEPCRVLATRGAEAVPALLALLSTPWTANHRLRSDVYATVVKNTAMVLVRIGDPRALEALEAYAARVSYDRALTEAIARMRSSAEQI